jgi:hypothetical protein
VFDDALNDFPIRAGGPQVRPPSESFDKGNNAFSRLPHVAARDHRLTAIELVLLAYRLTFADDKSAYALNENRLLKERRAGRIVGGRGFGKNAIRKAIAGLQAKSYLRRAQDKSRPDGKWGRARETLTPLARDCGASGNAGQHIRREWFDGSLTGNELAAILYLRAGTGKGPAHLRELAARFHWCRQTAEWVRRPCIRSIRWDRYHDAAMRIGAKLLGGGPILVVGTKAIGDSRVPHHLGSLSKTGNTFTCDFQVVGLRILNSLLYLFMRFMPLAT